MTEWFTDWFGHTYLELYPHRDEEDAKQALNLVSRLVPLNGLRVLDLACGPGRHAVPLNALGAKTTGVDLSWVLLMKARYGDPPVKDLVRADMRRLPFKPESFDAVLNLFTSFGYFANDREHERVLQQVASLLKSGGWFVIDFLNADQVRSGLVPQERVDVNGKSIEIQRRLVGDGAYVEKEMQLSDGTRHVERVRLFTAVELADMLTAAGLEMAAQFGDYHGGPVAPDAPRAVLFARKP